MTPDYTFVDHGSVWLVTPHTPDATDWLRGGVSAEAQWWGGALAVEPRYVERLAAGLREDGFSVGIAA